MQWPFLPISDTVGGATEMTWISLGTELHVATALAVTLHCLRRRREASAALFWILLAWTFPGVGALLYVTIGVDRVPAKAFHKRESNRRFQSRLTALDRIDGELRGHWRCSPADGPCDPVRPTARELNRAMNAILPEFPLQGGNDIRLLLTGDETYPAMLEAIASARHHIHLSTFIIGNDDTGRKFLDLLARKADEGVVVRFLYDRFGSTHALLSGFLHSYARRSPNLHLAGWTQANPLKRQFQINLRNHRKFLVVDGKIGFVGGINLHDEHTTRGAESPIRDYHFVLRGPVVQQLQYTFLRDWYFMTEEDPDELLSAAHFPRLHAAGAGLVRVINSGPSSRLEKIADTYFNAVILARRQILVVTPYFVPPADLIRAFRSAALRGVDVRLVVPRENNHVYAGLAGRAHYDELLQAGIRIFERNPPFMHAKAMIVDDELALVGTANLDARSLRLNYETNLAVFDDAFQRQLRTAVMAEFDASTEIRLEEWRKRSLRQRMLENFCALLAPVL